MKKPNILFIFPDQLSHRALGYKGEYPVSTPNIDAFAKEALDVDNAISNQPLCSPYRGMLMSGKYPHKNGVIMNCNEPRNQYGIFLKKGEKCITDILAENDYETAYVGKWHLDAPDPSVMPHLPMRDNKGVLWDSYTMPQRRHSIKFWHVYSGCDKDRNLCYFHNDAPYTDPIKTKEWSVAHEEKIVREYILNTDNIRDEEKPFVMFWSIVPPHTPYDKTPQKYRDLYADMSEKDLLHLPNFRDKNPTEHREDPDVRGGETARKDIREYLAAVTGVDEAFGNLVDLLKQKGVYNDTIIVFTSDHGEMMGSHNLMGKTAYYKESLKVPFLIRYPTLIDAGRADFVFNVPDIMPTLLSMVGLNDKIPCDVQGKNMASFFYGREEYATDGLYFNYFNNARGLKTKDYTFISETNYAGIETKVCLYDDKNDEYQLNEVSKQYPEKVEELRKQMNMKLAQIGDFRE